MGKFLSWLCLILLLFSPGYLLFSNEQPPRKILFIMPKMLLGGSEQAFLSLLNGWAVPNTKVEICLLKRGGVLESFIRKDFPILSTKEAFSRQYDVAVDYMGLSPRVSLWKARAKRKIQWTHTDVLVSKWGHPLKHKKLCHGIDAFVCVSEKVAESARKLQPQLDKKIFVIRNVLDGELVKRKAQEMTNCFPHDGLPVVLSVGRLSPEKGLERAIKVHSRLDREGISFRWYVVGEGCERSNLEHKIQEYGLAGKFILMGAKLNPYPYFAGADIFVLPSLYEGCSIVVNEAKILGLPILVTDVGAAREQIESEKNGLIVESSEQGLYLGLKRLLMDKDLRLSFSQALSTFTYDNSNIYRDLEHIFFSCA